ncbi:MAG: hypothetical protein AAGA11_05305 [Pseudomonadota bacterium]
MILLLPAAGHATRLPALGGRSKACMPIAPDRAAADALLDAAVAADTAHALWLIRDAGEDIRRHYGDAYNGLPLHYHTLPATGSTLDTLRRALAAPTLALDRGTLALGFPDMQFRDASALAALHTHHHRSGADLSLGCFETDRPDKVDVVVTDARGRVARIDIKSTSPGGTHGWILAVWQPRFTRFLLAQPPPAPPTHRAAERYLGHEIQAAIAAGLAVDAVHFDTPLLDLGTPEDLARAATFWAGGTAT